MRKLLFMIAMTLCVQASFAAQQVISENADEQKAEMTVASEKPVCHIWLVDINGIWWIRATYPIPYNLEVVVDNGIYVMNEGVQERSTFTSTSIPLEINDLSRYSDHIYDYAIGWAPY